MNLCLFTQRRKKYKTLLIWGTLHLLKLNFNLIIFIIKNDFISHLYKTFKRQAKTAKEIISYMLKI